LNKLVDLSIALSAVLRLLRFYGCSVFFIACHCDKYYFCSTL